MRQNKQLVTKGIEMKKVRSSPSPELATNPFEGVVLMLTIYELKNLKKLDSLLCELVVIYHKYKMSNNFNNPKRATHHFSKQSKSLRAIFKSLIECLSA